MKHTINSLATAAFVAIVGGACFAATPAAPVLQPSTATPPKNAGQTTPNLSAPVTGSQTPTAGALSTGTQPTVTMTPTLPSAPAHYYVYDVAPVVLDGNNGLFRLNQSGQMIWNSSGHAFMYQNCQARDLASLGGGQARARSINNAGVIVGSSTQPGGRWRAFAYANGKMRDLGGSTDKLINEGATAINFWGDIVGVESVGGGLAPTAVRYQDGVAAPMARVLLRPPSGFAIIGTVVDLSDSREIVGTLSDGGVTVAFKSSNFGSLWGKMAGVPGFESSGTTPNAMNRYGHVAGTAGNGFVRAFISRDPSAPAVDLGTLGGQLSMGLGINNYSWVVGWAEQTSGGGPRAFVHDGTRMIDLNTVLWNGTGWLLREAMAINDAGQIVGEGFFNGQPHAFLLQPMAKAPVFNPCQPVNAAR